MNNALFGHRLRTYRKEKGLTIEKLAKQVGLSPNYLGDVERGKKLPSMATFIRLVNVLGETGNNVMMRLMGLILMVIGVECFVGGVKPILLDVLAESYQGLPS